VVVGLGVVKIGGRGGGPLRGGSRNLDLSVVLGVNLLKNSSKFTVVDGAMGIGVVVWMKRSAASTLVPLKGQS